MGVSLFTVRIVLSTLGVVDYGIHSVVGGIVVMFSFLSNAMASASQRYFAFEIGRNDYDRLQRIFSMLLLIYFVLAVIIFLLSQTIGMWFLINKINIPIERMPAAKWVFHFSVLSFMFTMLAVPYNALIIAKERMNVYAWVSIVEVLLKLLIVYLLIVLPGDKLISYAVLTFVVTVIVTLIYRIYCNKKYSESKYKYYWDKPLFKELISYSGWNLFGAIAGVFNLQGINIVLNIFFGPVVNSARAIAYQVGSSLNLFVLNFMTATRPQITKLFASGERSEMVRLVFQASKFSYYLLFILTIPIIMEVEFILQLWLNEVPLHTVLFTKLILIAVLIDSISYSLQTAAQATGKIRLYQFIVGGMMIINLPVAFFFLKLGFQPESVFYVSIVNSIICLCLRLVLLRKMIDLDILDFIKKVMIPIISVSFISIISVYFILGLLEYGFVRFVVILLSSLLLTSTYVFLFGINKSERSNLFNHIKSKFSS